MELLGISRPGIESVSVLETLRSTAEFGYGLIDVERRFVSVNEALAALHGLPVEEHSGRFVADVVPGLWSQLEPVLETMLASGRCVLTREFVGACAPDPARIATWVTTFYPVRSGGELAGIGFIVRDVTELRQSEALRSVMMQTITEGLIALDAHGRLLCMNAVAEQLLGWSEDELLGREVHGLIHRGAHGAAPAPRHCPLAGGHRRAPHAMEDAFVCRDGRILPVLSTVSPEPAGGVVIVFRDATEEIEGRWRAEREGAINWLGSVREAFDEDRLELYSQPIIPLTGGVAREELLLRMITRGGDVVAAREFIGAVENFSLIVEIDRWVIAQAARYAALGRIVHVNVSAASTAHGDLLDFIARELRAVGAPAANVIFELHEPAFLSNPSAAEALAAGLRELGCGLALDDLGTGDGSLTYLKRFPAQSLKIDVGFVRDLSRNEDSQRLVRSIVRLARSFGRETIAEGVEDRQTLALLRDYGVDYAQGYYISCPAPIEPPDGSALPERRERRPRPACADELLAALERSWLAAGPS
jgi:PAS domain S-box-containing protein